MAKPKNKLGVHKGKRVSKIVIAITNAGDGLSKEMSIEPELIELGEIKEVVLRTVAAKETYVPDPDDPEAVILKMSLKALLATIVEAELVEDVLTKHQEKLDAAAGITKLPFEGDEGGADGAPADGDKDGE